MSRYIDADELCKKLNNGFDWIKDNLSGDFQSGALANLTDVINTISNKQLVPTAVVKPVVRGEWILTEYTYGCKKYRCSNCVDDDWWDKKFAYGDEKFCPNCGADMRGEKDNEKV